MAEFDAETTVTEAIAATYTFQSQVEQARNRGGTPPEQPRNKAGTKAALARG